MSSSVTRRSFALGTLCAGLPVSLPPTSAEENSESHHALLVVVGPSKHPPGTHEVAATGRLLQHCLTQLAIPDTKVELLFDWPHGDSMLERARTIVFVGDLFPPARMADSPKIMSDLNVMMKRGTGMVCIHYATGLSAQDVADDGAHPLLQWIGGYFATKCKHHQSIARVFEEATIVPAPIAHEIHRGWKAFTLHDEPYINNYFGKSGMRPDVVPLATSNLPPDAPRAETVAWAVERPDGGRGAGIVMPHFFRNWLHADLRKFLLNSIVWSAKLPIPENGIEAMLSDLAQFQPESVEPIVKNAKAKS